MVFDGHAHEGMAVGGYTPSAGMRDFGDEAADVESLEDTRDLGAEFSLSSGVRGRIKGFADVGVAEAVQAVLTGGKRPENRDIFLGGRIKAAISALIMDNAAGAGAKELLRFVGIMNNGERLQVSGVGGLSDFGVTIETGDALGHRKPADDSFAFTIAMTASEKAIRMIDDGFDAEHDAELGIHFDPVFADAVFNAHAFGSGLEIGDDFRSEVMSQFFSEECQDISGAKTQKGMFDEFAE